MRKVHAIVTWLALCAAACDSEPAPARITREPAHGTEPEQPSREAPMSEPAAPPPVAPTQAEVEAASMERAIEPVEDAATVVTSVTRGQLKYVLFQWDGVAVARETVLAVPGGEERLDDIDLALESCDDADDYSRFDCVVSAVPDAYLAMAALGSGHAWGVAVLEARDGAYVRTARRFLSAWSEDEGSALDRSAEIRARDVDADGDDELIVTLPIVPLRGDLGMNGGDSAVVAYVLDAGDLRTQIRVTSDYESTMMDVAGTTHSCRGAWRFTDVNHDGHDDVSINARCNEHWQDDESGDSRDRRQNDRRDCLYDAASDAWPCGAPPIADWLFSRSSEGIVAERPEDLAAALGSNLGSEFEQRLAEQSGDEEMEEEPAAAAPSAPTPQPSAPPAARACVHVVDDPAPPLRVRATPSTRGEVAGELANGTELSLLERRGRWARIARPTAGWVWTENLRERCTP